MFEIVSEHQFWTAVVIYWIFSAAVSSIIKASPWRARASRPEPGPNGSPAYLWFYRFLHSIAGNITTAFGSKIPGVKTMTVILLIPILLSVSACRAHYAIHPGALNTADSAAYDTLLVASATIDTVRPSKRGRTACGFPPVHLECFRSHDEVGQAFCESRSTLEAGSYRFLLFKIGAARRGFLRHH